MKLPHAIVLVAFMGLVGFLAWLTATKAEDPTVFIGLIGLLVIAALIGLFAAFAKSATGPAQTAYIAAITGLLGAIGGLVGGTAIGQQAGETAAKQVKEDKPSK